jgi:hypothetical protein
MGGAENAEVFVKRVVVAIAFAMIACKSEPSTKMVDASIVDSSIAIDANVASSISNTIDARAPVTDASIASSSFNASTADGGIALCPRIFGPIAQSFLGPAALDITSRGLEIIFNDHGSPRTSIVAIKAPPPPSQRTRASSPSPSSATHDVVTWPPCVVGGHYTYCVGSGSTLVRFDRTSNAKKELARPRMSTRIAAASMGRDHSVVAYLNDKLTSEGFLSEAFVIVDEEPAVRISDEAGGATFVDLASHGDGVLAAYLDARMAMTPVHARPIAWNDGKSRLGEDVVLYVAGVPERGISAVLGTTNAHVDLFLPVSREPEGFGLATLRVEDPPRDNVEASWSMYPNGLDPAPIAATRSLHDKLYVARIRPKTPAPKSTRVVELGRVESNGAFTPLDVLAEGRTLTDLAIAIDSFDTVWILYSDATDTWLERRVCP